MKRQKQSDRGKPSNYLQSRILLLIIMFIAVIGVIVTAMSSFLYKNYLQKSLLQNAEVNLQFLADNIDGNMSNIKRLVNFCNTNLNIGEFTEVGKASRPLSLKAYERLNEEYQANEAGVYMHRIVVASNTGSFLQIVSNSYANSRNAVYTAREFPYFGELLESDGYSFTPGFVEDGFYTGKLPTRVLPVLRPISARYNASSTGWILIYVMEDLFTDPLSYYSRSADSELYLTLGEHHYLLTKEGCEASTPNFTLRNSLDTDFLTSDTQANYVVNNDSGRRSLLLTTPLKEMPGCYISQTISQKELNTQRTLFLTTLICIILLIVVIGMLVSYLLYRTLAIPVLKIRSRVNLISQGDFTPDPAIEWNHELGDIGRGINEMSENIVALMNHRLEDEKQKRDLEYKMLQSQINPHFIYNTLNSIKWMATIQGSEGIAEMTTALSRLLKSISKGTSLLVPIREELALLQDYFTIQQYRYGGTITMNISVDEEPLYDYQIVKFTLQPLVENAIFHGIEPKGEAGTITISVSSTPEDDILILVADDGVGMSREKADRLLLDDTDRAAEFFREIGVSNVHKRLRYEFGERYGITIDSREGEYTRMKLLLPKRKTGTKG